MANIPNSMSTTPAQPKPLSSTNWTIVVTSLTGVSVATLNPTKNDL